ATYFRGPDHSYGSGIGYIFIGLVQCSGNEYNLLACSLYHSAGCDHSEDVGVSCSLNTSESLPSPTVSTIILTVTNSFCEPLSSSPFNQSSITVTTIPITVTATATVESTAVIMSTIVLPIILLMIIVLLISLTLIFYYYKIRKAVNRKPVSGKRTSTAKLDNDVVFNIRYNDTNQQISCSQFTSFPLPTILENQVSDACTTGQVRLANGATSNQGRVEICINGVWGTVCDDFWVTNNNARVVCRQLGYSTDGARAFTHAYYGQGTGPIVLDNVVCSGNESNLLACSSYILGTHNCDHSEDVGVSCSSLPATATPNAVGGTAAAKASAIVLAVLLLILIIIISLMSLSLIYYYRTRKAVNNKEPVCDDRRSSTLKELEYEDVANSEVVFNMSYDGRQDSLGSASLPLPPIPEDLYDRIYTEIKDCYL
uniref:SRCR domain-containing protein n=1 Tax=Amphimedon queenslandica TaxID=400682 RepID=A0A1X7T0E0_AMPQE